MVSLTAQAKRRSTVGASEIAFNVIRPLKVTISYRELIIGDGVGSKIMHPFQVGWVFDLNVGIEPIALRAHCVYPSHITSKLCQRLMAASFDISVKG